MTLLQRIRALVAWVQRHLPAWPSWLIEGLVGKLLAVPAVLLLVVWHQPILSAIAMLMARGVSELYELFFDANGYEPQDVLERDRGLILALAVAVAFGI